MLGLTLCPLARDWVLHFPADSCNDLQFVWQRGRSMKCKSDQSDKWNCQCLGKATRVHYGNQHQIQNKTTLNCESPRGLYRSLYTVYRESCRGEKEIKSDTERMKLVFHISSAHSSSLSPSEALGRDLLNSWFSLVSLVASESEDQKDLFPIYTTSFTCTWVCVSWCFPLALPFTTQETSWAGFHLTARG